MDKKFKVLITLFVLIGLVAFLFYITGTISRLTGYTAYELDTENLAKCLTQKGAKMYGAYLCGHCQNQKAMFGDAFQFINYVECDPRGENPQTEFCLEKNIKGYPTWEINGNFYPGEMTFERLAELSECDVE